MSAILSVKTKQGDIYGLKFSKDYHQDEDKVIRGIADSVITVDKHGENKHVFYDSPVIFEIRNGFCLMIDPETTRGIATEPLESAPTVTGRGHGTEVLLYSKLPQGMHESELYAADEMYKQQENLLTDMGNEWQEYIQDELSVDDPDIGDM